MTSQDRANHLLSLDQQARRMNLSDAAREEILAGADLSAARPIIKRDYFAAAALKAVIQTCNLDNKQAGESDEQMFARKALACADALIAASKTGGPEHG